MDKILKSYADKITVETVLQNLNAIKERFSESGVTAENVSIVLLALMSEVNNFKKLTGSQKKTLVTVILNHFISELTSEDNQPALREILKLTVPTLIDNFIDISKGIELHHYSASKLFNFSHMFSICTTTTGSSE
tara:strand:+ start:57 stop:461 length:405 start_codon:yes stop_codon:yes gene_type:complete